MAQVGRCYIEWKIRLRVAYPKVNTVIRYRIGNWKAGVFYVYLHWVTQPYLNPVLCKSTYFEVGWFLPVPRVSYRQKSTYVRH